MTTPRTPSKLPLMDLTFLECTWSIHEKGFLYVRVSPTVAKAMVLRGAVHIKMLGRIQTVVFTKKFVQGQVKQDNVLKLHVNAYSDEVSQDMDEQTTTWYAVQENRFADISGDATAKKGKFFGSKWVTNQATMDAYDEAARKKQLGQRGNWLKNVLKSDLTETQQPQSCTQAFGLEPAAFAFSVPKSTEKDDSDDEKESMATLFGDDESEEESSFQSQQFEEKQRGAHFQSCQCWFFCLFCMR